VNRDSPHALRDLARLRVPVARGPDRQAGRNGRGGKREEGFRGLF
jgi:hypothetical protein